MYSLVWETLHVMLNKQQRGAWAVTKDCWRSHSETFEADNFQNHFVNFLGFSFSLTTKPAVSLAFNLLDELHETNKK